MDHSNNFLVYAICPSAGVPKLKEYSDTEHVPCLRCEITEAINYVGSETGTSPLPSYFRPGEQIQLPQNYIGFRRRDY